MAYHARSVRDDIHYETLPPKTKQQQNRPPWGYFLLGMALDAPPTAIDHTKKASHGRNVNLDLSMALPSLPLSVAAVYGHRAAYCRGRFCPSSGPLRNIHAASSPASARLIDCSSSLIISQRRRDTVPPWGKLPQSPSPPSPKQPVHFDSDH